MSRTYGWLSLGVVSAAWMASALATGCAGDPEPFVPLAITSGSGAGVGGSGGMGGGAVNAGEEMFRALEDDFVTACGSCHKVGGSADTPFLGDPETGDPDPYEAATSWPGVIVKEETSSILITWPESGAHQGGPNDAGLEAKLIAWLAEEAKAVAAVDQGDPVIPPFKPIVPGFNAVYLDALGPEFLGMAVTFQAEELTDMSLSLSSIQVHPTGQMGLELDHPLFTVYPTGSTEGDPDPVDSFSNVSQSVEPGTVAPLGPGSVVLTNWSSGAKLSLAFSSITTIDPMAMGGGGMGMGGPCMALTDFSDSAGPALENSCTNCHGGNNQAATNAVDMTDLGSDDSAACGQILNRVDLANPAQSQLFVVTDPSGNASHPFKFGGSNANHDNFVQAVSQWIEAEAN